MTQAKVIKLLEDYKNNNSEKYGILNIGIFGSYSTNKEKHNSDIDIVIETTEPDLYKMVHIKNELEKLFHKSIDIVRKREKMNPYLKKHIEKDAIYV